MLSHFLVNKKLYYMCLPQHFTIKMIIALVEISSKFSILITTQFHYTYFHKTGTFLQFGRHTNEAFMTFMEFICTLDSIRFFAIQI